MNVMTQPPATGTDFRPFGRSDFARLINWMDSPEALPDWAAILFDFPLTESQLEAYLGETETGRRQIYVAVDEHSGRELGHIELSNILPHLSAFVSRVLVGDRALRGRGLGKRMVGELARRAFAEFAFHRLDLGVLATNLGAIRCYEKVGFRYIGTWHRGLKKGAEELTVNWMTLFRADFDRAH
jgi:RimJ/RimL family protein N-acetyltransferase